MINEKYLEKFQEVISQVEQLNATIFQHFGDDDEFEGISESILDNYHSLFERFCPFKIGDRVILAKNPENEEYFLIEGAIAIVQDRGYKKGKFVFKLEFDRTQIDSSGNIVTITPPTPTSPPLQLPLPFTMAPYPPETIQRVLNTHYFEEDWIKPLPLINSSN